MCMPERGERGRRPRRPRLGDVAGALDWICGTALEDADQVDRGIGAGERAATEPLSLTSARTSWTWRARERLEEPGAPGVALGDADAHAGLQQRLGT